jgi:hypothetical protein
MKYIALASLLLLVSMSSFASDNEPADAIRILSLDPPGPVPRGVETEFTVEVEADLKSTSEGEADIGFNTESPKSFRMIDSHLLVSGPQKFTFKVKVITVDWGERAKFKVMVNMGARPTKGSWKPTATDDREIELMP